MPIEMLVEPSSFAKEFILILVSSILASDCILPSESSPKGIVSYLNLSLKNLRHANGVCRRWSGYFLVFMNRLHWD